MEVVKDGWMSKCGGRIKTWYKRWFKLVGTSLIYSKNPGVKESGHIDLLEATFIGTAPDCKRQPAIQIQTPSRIYYMQANSEEDQNSWIDALSSVSNNSKSTDVPVDLHSRLQTIRLIYSGMNLLHETDEIIDETDHKSLVPILLCRHIVTKALYLSLILRENQDIQYIKDTLSEIESPYIYSICSTWHKSNNVDIIYTDFVPGFDLPTALNYIYSFSEKAVRIFAAELFSLIESVHKTGNIISPFRSEQVFLTQTGHIRFFWIPRRDSKSDKKSNYQKFWMIIFEMLNGFNPETILPQIENDYSKLPYTKGVSETAQDLIQQLQTADENSFSEIVYSHPFFSGIDWDAIASSEPVSDFQFDSDEIDSLWIDSESYNNSYLLIEQL